MTCATQLQAFFFHTIFGKTWFTQHHHFEVYQIACQCGEFVSAGGSSSKMTFFSIIFMFSRLWRILIGRSCPFVPRRRSIFEPESQWPAAFLSAFEKNPLIYKSDCILLESWFFLSKPRLMWWSWAPKTPVSFSRCSRGQVDCIRKTRFFSYLIFGVKKNSTHSPLERTSALFSLKKWFQLQSFFFFNVVQKSIPSDLSVFVCVSNPS